MIKKTELASTDRSSEESDALSVEQQSSSHPILHACRKLGRSLRIEVEDKQSGFMVSMSGETEDGEVVETDRCYMSNEQLCSHPTIFDQAISFLLKKYEED